MQGRQLGDRHPDAQIAAVMRRIEDPSQVVDELVALWEFQDVDGYVRFDTRRFRCAVPAHATEAIAYLREVARRRREGDRRRPLLALYATVQRAPLWGRVAAGEAEGVASEQIVLVCDRIERPRWRFFEEGE